MLTYGVRCLSKSLLHKLAALSVQPLRWVYDGRTNISQTRRRLNKKRYPSSLDLEGLFGWVASQLQHIQSLHSQPELQQPHGQELERARGSKSCATYCLSMISRLVRRDASVTILF